MIKDFIEWEKDRKKIKQEQLMCECGGVMRQVGSAGCPHEENYTYFFQCQTCKGVQTQDYCERGEDLSKYGWTKVLPQ